MSTPHRFAYDAGQIDPINDPGTGNSFAIKGRSLIRCEMESAAGSETRTLPIPSAAGQIFQLIHAIDGGDVDVTVTSGFDNAGDTAMNTATAGDFVTFMSVKTAASTYRWRILGFEGFTGISEIGNFVDLNGLADGLVLDADADTTISSPTDDQIDFEAGGTDRFRIVEGDAYDVDFNPATRVFRRYQFDRAITTKAIVSDYSSPSSLGSFDPNWVMSGSANGSVAGFQASADSDGGMILSHIAKSSSFVFIKPATGQLFDRTKWGTSKNPRMRVVMQTGSSVANALFVCGLYSAATAPNKFDATAKAIRAEFFFNQTVNASWKVDVAGTGSSSRSGDTSTAVATSTVYDLDIRVQSDRTVKCYINGALVYTSVKVLTATKNLIPMIGLATTGDVHRPIKIYHIELSQDIAA